MNNIIFQTIRAGVVLGIALFAFVGEVFATPILTPTETIQIAETTAVLVGHVDNTNKTSVVWFEWNEGSSMYSPITIGMKSIYSNGYFQGYLKNLKPGTVYSYRAVAAEGGTTVYSPVVSFRTKGGTVAPSATTVLYPSPTFVAPVQTVAQTQAVVQVPVKKKSTTPVATAKKAPSATVVATTKDGFTNGSVNTATVLGAGDGVLPRTLIGWIALLIALLIAILIGRMIYESSEKRKKARLAKKLASEEKENNEILKK